MSSAKRQECILLICRPHVGAVGKCTLFIPFVYNLDSVKAELQGKAQPKVVVPVAGCVVVPIRHTAVPGVVVPAAATVHAVRALAGTFRGYVASSA